MEDELWTCCSGSFRSNFCAERSANDRGEGETTAPSAKPNDSTTGNRLLIVKKAVPSFISSDTMRPLRLAMTP